MVMAMVTARIMVIVCVDDGDRFASADTFGNSESITPHTGTAYYDGHRSPTHI